MTPEEFSTLQRQLLTHAEEQTKLIKRIGDKVEFLGWAIIVIVGVLVTFFGR